MLMQQIYSQGIGSHPQNQLAQRFFPRQLPFRKCIEQGNCCKQIQYMIVVIRRMDKITQPPGLEIDQSHPHGQPIDQQTAAQVAQRRPLSFLQEGDTIQAHISRHQENTDKPQAIVAQVIRLQFDRQHRFADGKKHQQQDNHVPQLLLPKLPGPRPQHGRKQVHNHIGRDKPVMRHLIGQQILQQPVYRQLSRIQDPRRHQDRGD